MPAKLTGKTPAPSCDTWDMDATRNATRSATRSDTSDPPPVLIGKQQAARMCGLSRSTWDTYRAAGWVPDGVRIGNVLRWRVDALREWIEAGCPRQQ
jgi:predicted DNA-binding transcriptional regulator AlpA